MPAAGYVQSTKVSNVLAGNDLTTVHSNIVQGPFVLSGEQIHEGLPKRGLRHVGN